MTFAPTFLLGFFGASIHQGARRSGSDERLWSGLARGTGAVGAGVSEGAGAALSAGARTHSHGGERHQKSDRLWVVLNITSQECNSWFILRFWFTTTFSRRLLFYLSEEITKQSCRFWSLELSRITTVTPKRLGPFFVGSATCRSYRVLACCFQDDFCYMFTKISRKCSWSWQD